MIRRLGILLGLCALVATTAAAPAFAAVDLTGDWFFEIDDSILLQTVEFPTTLTQDDGVLLWGPDAVGTVNAATGILHVEGAGPAFSAPNWDATTSADGNRFFGTYSEYLGPAAGRVSMPLRGIRRRVAICGDLQRDPGEACDHGPGNGVDQCCDKACALVDTDGDGVCSDIDNCPGVSNADQADVCGGSDQLGIDKLILKAAKHLPATDDSRIELVATLPGISAGQMLSLAMIHLSDSNSPEYDLLVTNLACVRTNPTRLDCQSPDGRSAARLVSGAGGSRLTATLLSVGLPAPPATLVAPLTISLTDNFGTTRSATY